MKYLVTAGAILLVLLAFVGCEQNQWEETTLTIVNENSEAITHITLNNGYLGRSVGANILEPGETVPTGESITIPLAPVLHPADWAFIYLSNGTFSAGREFSYTEGAEVEITFTSTGTPEIAGGEFAPQPE